MVQKTTKLHRIPASARIEYGDYVVCIDSGGEVNVQWAIEHARSRRIVFLVTSWHRHFAYGIEPLNGRVPVFGPLFEDREQANPSIEFAALRPGERVLHGPFTITALQYMTGADHRLPALVYHIATQDIAVQYAPIVSADCTPAPDLFRATIVVGDGSALMRSRMLGGYKHVPMLAQLELAQATGVRQFYFTSFGPDVVRAGDLYILRRIRAKKPDLGFKVVLPADGMRLDAEDLDEMKIARAAQLAAADWRKVPTRELLILHLRCHQLWRSPNIHEDTKRLLEKVHDAIVREMIRRGLDHKSELT